MTKPGAEAALHSAEMARWPRCWGVGSRRSLWSVALERSPGDREAVEALARLERAGPARGGPTLAGLLADLGPAPARGTRSSGGLSAPPAFIDDAEACGLRFRFDTVPPPPGRSPRP